MWYWLEYRRRISSTNWLKDFFASEAPWVQGSATLGMLKKPFRGQFFFFATSHGGRKDGLEFPTPLAVFLGTKPRLRSLDRIHWGTSGSGRYPFGRISGPQNGEFRRIASGKTDLRDQKSGFQIHWEDQRRPKVAQQPRPRRGSPRQLPPAIPKKG